MKVKPKKTVETMLTLDEMQELMDEFCSSIPFDGPLPTLAETDYLAEETDEVAESRGKSKSKLKKR